MPESNDLFKFVSQQVGMSGQFDSRKDLFVKLSFRELCGLKLTDLPPLDNTAIIHWVKIGQKQKDTPWVHERPILEVIFVTLTEISSVITNDNQEP